MNRKLCSRLLLASSLVFLIQCSPGGFKSENASGTNSIASNPSPAPTGGNDAEDEAEARRRQLYEVISNTPMQGVNAKGEILVDFDRANGNYLLQLPLPNFPVGGILDMTFKDYPGMRLSMNFVADRPVFVLVIPAKYVLRNVTEVVAKLPNGSPVPFFPAGEAPSKGILLTPNRENKIYLYLSAEAFGLFVETGFDPVPDNFPLTAMIPIKSQDGLKNLGYISTVDKIGNFKGGFFISHRIDPKLGKILDEYYLF